MNKTQTAFTPTPLPGIHTPISMTRKEADEAMQAINAACMDCVLAIKKAKRARSWTQALKIATIQTETANLHALRMLHQRIGEAFDLGGY